MMAVLQQGNRFNLARELRHRGSGLSSNRNRIFVFEKSKNR
ncbi:hypothetical protein [Gloeocapsopsis sp. IPPAS B-1203]|nr:hypothetical protein [Gloeocapsopsis sp. IPPAS B-1203]